MKMKAYLKTGDNEEPVLIVSAKFDKTDRDFKMICQKADGSTEPVGEATRIRVVPFYDNSFPEEVLA